MKVLKGDGSGGEGCGHYVAINGNAAMWLRSFTIGHRKGESIFLTDMNTEDLRTISDFVSRGTLKPVVQSRLDFKQPALHEGFESLKSRRTVGKIVFTVAG